MRFPSGRIAYGSQHLSSMKKLALVIGHGPKIDKGAENGNGTTELEWNQELANRIKSHLNGSQLECKVIHRVTEKVSPTNEVNAAKADFAVELHCNAYNEVASGTEVIYYPGSKEGQRLANTILSRIVPVLNLPNRGVKTPQAGGRGMSFLAKTNCPAVIAESMFIDNIKDLARANDVKDELAAAYAAAFLAFAGVNSSTPPKDESDDQPKIYPDKIIKITGLPWTVEVFGDDLVIRDVKATCFGGSSDRMDNGMTASGFPTKGHDEFVGCSLPMRHPNVKGLRNSPIPLMPYGVFTTGEDNPSGAHCEITYKNGDKHTMPVIDLGPDIGRFPENALDLTVGAARLENKHATANNFSTIVRQVKIIGGAKYLPKENVA